MKGLLRRMLSLRMTLPAIVLLCWLIPTVLLGTFMGTRFFTALQEKTENYLIAGAEEARTQTLQNLSKVITLSKDAVYDGELSDAVNGYESGSQNYESYFRNCRSYLERKYGRERLCDFALFFRERDPSGIFFTTDDYQEATYFQQNVQPSVLALSDELDTRCGFYAYGGRTYLVRNLFNTKMEKYGMLILGINTERLLTPVKQWVAQWDAQYSVTLDAYGMGNLEHMDAEDGLSEKNGLLLYTTGSSSRDYELRFQMQADKSVVYHEMETFRMLMVWMFVLVLPLCLSIMYFVNRRIVGPIKKLSDASTRIREGELGVTVPMRGTDELGQLGLAFSEMSTRLKILVDKSYKEEIALRDARIQAMQSRINPHFLNNALETINWQARMEESETISAMVEALSLLLNASMDRGNRHLVPLREELEIANAYFYFIGLRFGERLTVYQDIAEGLERQLVPRLIIQTLLENAIEHGIAPAGGGRIGLNIFTDGEKLHVEVLNNGKKISAEDRKRINALLADETERSSHLGIRNVARRLRLLYGKNARLTIQTDAHGQTVAAIVLPLETDGEEALQEEPMELERGL